MTDNELRSFSNRSAPGRRPSIRPPSNWGRRRSADLGFANVDLHRRDRCGFPEVIFSEGKTPEWLEGVVRQLAAAGQDCLATRLERRNRPGTWRSAFRPREQDRFARTFWLPQKAPAADPRPGGRADGRHQRSARRPGSRGDGDRSGLRCYAHCRRRRRRASSAVAPSRRIRQCRRHRRGRGHGRCAAERRRRTGRLSGDRGADERRLRRGVSRRGAAADDAQRLLGERRGRQHRQRLQGRLRRRR